MNENHSPANLVLHGLILSPVHPCQGEFEPAAWLPSQSVMSRMHGSGKFKFFSDVFRPLESLDAKARCLELN